MIRIEDAAGWTRNITDPEFSHYRVNGVIKVSLHLGPAHVGSNRRVWFVVDVNDERVVVDGVPLRSQSKVNAKVMAENWLRSAGAA